LIPVSSRLSRPAPRCYTGRVGEPRKERIVSKSDKDGGKMTAEAASRIQSAAAKNPESSSAKSGFAPRAQSSAAKDGGKK